MKSPNKFTGEIPKTVAPREGAWVEILQYYYYNQARKVAPREGAWVEILPAVGKLTVDFVAPREGGVG